jgi:RHS repeat-associated protein
MFRRARHWVGLLLFWSVFAGQVGAMPCDVDNDSDIDLDDLNLIQKAILARERISGPGDPRDPDSNALINSIDGRLCALRCTRVKCAATNSAPLANAGSDQNRPLGSLISLDGSASRDPENATLTYAWSLIGRPAGSRAVLAAANSANPTFPADLPGEYVVQLIVNDGQLASTPAKVAITVTNTPPTIRLNAPLANQQFSAPATITVSAEAADSTGSITEVAFYEGSTPLGSATSVPYQVTWNNVPAGGYVLKARATDSSGATTWSAEVSISVTAGGARVYYLHHDHLNTPRMVTDETNKIVWRNTPLGEPFGMGLPEEDPDGDRQTFILNLRFPGQYADRESHLNYNYFRDYNPELGRYLQSDPIGLAAGVNTYEYVYGNPGGRIDPKGLAYFGFRPLQPLFPFMILAPLMGTWQIAHENVFFEDGSAPSNFGFGPSGVSPDPFPFGYKISDGGYNDCIMRIAVSMNAWPGSQYRLYCTNCQRWSLAVRATYNDLAKDHEIIQKCGCSESSLQAASRIVPFFSGRSRQSDDPLSASVGSSQKNPGGATGTVPLLPLWVMGL